jgi:hypothetical protein
VSEGVLAVTERQYVVYYEGIQIIDNEGERECALWGPLLSVRLSVSNTAALVRQSGLVDQDFR